MVYGQNEGFIIFVLKALVEPQGVRRCRDECSTTPVSRLLVTDINGAVCLNNKKLVLYMLPAHLPRVCPAPIPPAQSQFRHKGYKYKLQSYINTSYTNKLG
jgi:hypothetical protein